MNVTRDSMLPAPDLAAENARLKERIEDLEEEVRQLKADHFKDEIYIPIEWVLTQKEAGIVRALSVGRVVSKGQLLDSISHANGEQPEIKIVDVFICKIRKKLKPFGLEITTHWGAGYSLPEATLAVLRAAQVQS
jgi:two-component system, cell cycle response regulator CtrA